MSSWLKKPKRDDEPLRVRPDINDVLPPSVRHPEGNRFTPPESDAPEDVDDADLAFLTTLANEVDRAAVTKSIAKPAAAPLRGASSRIDDLQVFREMKDDSKEAMRFDHKLRDVDMADLLEELSDVQAALRQRKAA